MIGLHNQKSLQPNLWKNILSNPETEQPIETRSEDQDLIFSEYEIADMSSALVRKFGAQAIHIAAFFLDEHLELQDHARAESWLRVMTHLDHQYKQTLSESPVN